MFSAGSTLEQLHICLSQDPARPPLPGQSHATSEELPQRQEESGCSRSAGEPWHCDSPALRGGAPPQPNSRAKGSPMTVPAIRFIAHYVHYDRFIAHLNDTSPVTNQHAAAGTRWLNALYPPFHLPPPSISPPFSAWVWFPLLPKCSYHKELQLPQ